MCEYTFLTLLLVFFFDDLDGCLLFISPLNLHFYCYYFIASEEGKRGYIQKKRETQLGIACSKKKNKKKKTARYGMSKSEINK